MSAPKNHDAFEALLDYLKRVRGFDFTAYKRAGLERRVQRRMQQVGINDYAAYVDYLEVHPEEFGHLFDSILINVTSFFRDDAAWDVLAKEIVPKIVEQKRPGEAVRIWSAGCASGEEAYTLAIVMAEQLGTANFPERVKIYATDVDEDALNRARAAIYPAEALSAVPPPLLEKYFERANSNNQYAFHKDLRRSVIFGRHDLIQDAPISRIDLLVCRNTLMYFNAETQSRILARFHFAVADSGYLFLGKAEMLLTHSNIFLPVNLKRRIFAKVPKVNLRDRLLVLAQTGREEGIENNLINHVRLREAAFETDPQAQMVLDANGTVTLINEQARGLFGVTVRDLGRPFQDLEISYRPIELRSLIEQAINQRHAAELKEARWPAPSGEARFFDVEALPLLDIAGTLLGVKLQFRDVTRYKQLQEELQQSNQELETAYEELQTSNEELQSTNEELETTNEELQSTNEELETMNEELQSSNEELRQINDELHLRTDELNQVNAFLESILTSLKGGVVVIDRDLQVQVWNNRSEDLWGVRPDEAHGKHFLNLDIGLPVQDLRQPIRACLAGEAAHEEVMLRARTRRGKDIDCLVICSPLLGATKEIRGVILLMEEKAVVHGDGEPAKERST
jgi:two-component system CheB/CheR fusion protein